MSVLVDIALFRLTVRYATRCGNSGRIGGFARLHQRSSLFEDLCAFLQRAECTVGPRHGQDVEVEVPLAYSEAQARRELEIYLATCRR